MNQHIDINLRYWILDYPKVQRF